MREEKPVSVGCRQPFHNLYLYCFYAAWYARIVLNFFDFPKKFYLFHIVHHRPFFNLGGEKNICLIAQSQSLSIKSFSQLTDFS